VSGREYERGKFVVLGECDNHRDILFFTHNKRCPCNYVAYVYKVYCKQDVFLLHLQRGWILSEYCEVNFSPFSDTVKMLQR
jgi:hypothetical protein